MPFEIKFENVPVGYAVTSGHAGEKVTLCSTGFVSSEDGIELITKLEGLPQQILSMLPLPAPVRPSLVDSLLAVIRRDKTATVYVNEVQLIGQARLKGPCKKGEAFTADRILDMGPMRFRDVDIPSDAAIVYVFSVGWRKGFFFDLGSLQGANAGPRNYDLEEQIGNLYAYLTFQERFRIDDITWRTLFAQKWFPFAYLDGAILRAMVSHAREGWMVDELLPKIAANVNRLVNETPLTEIADPAFADHTELLARAQDRYLAGDHISCTSILYPRIEGLLRSFHRAAGYTSEPSAKTLSKVAVAHHEADRISQSLLLPARFNEYLDTVYFAHFAPGSAPDVNRHSVAHGEARSGDFSLKSATIGFLVIYQLFSFFSSGKRPNQRG